MTILLDNGDTIDYKKFYPIRMVLDELIPKDELITYDPNDIHIHSIVCIEPTKEGYLFKERLYTLKRTKKE
jgi:hypothetical protein